MCEASSQNLIQPRLFKSHEDYERFLQNAAAEWFNNRGYKTQEGKKAYILDQSDMWLENIICSDVRDYLSEKPHEKEIDIHEWAHSGVSSQAMAFNLLGPLVKRKDFKPLQKALAEKNIKWSGGKNSEAYFEYKEHKLFKEDHLHPTSIDMYLKGESGDSLFIEVKLKEPEFGGCSIFSRGDCEGRNPYPGRLSHCYLLNARRTYWQKFDELEFYKSRLANGEICPFANYYQFFREVMFALCKEGTFILLHDDRNPAFLRRADDGTVQGGLWPFLYESIPPRWQNRVGRLSIQSLVKEIQESPKHQDWIYEFKEKYGLK